MSYTIEYDRQFIRSERGITPCWLAGESNVTEFGRKGRERRSREWMPFLSMIGKTESELAAAVADWTGTELWKKKGKWMSADDVRKWMRSGCKTAATVEEILHRNSHRITALVGRVAYRQEDGSYIHDKMTAIRTTQDMDAWIDYVRDREEYHAKHGEKVFAVIDFGTENLLHTSGSEKTLDDDKLVLLAKGIGSSRRYAYEIDERSVTYGPDPKKALAMPVSEANALRRAEGSSSWIRTATLVDADIQNDPYNAVILFVDGSNMGYYVYQRTGGTFRGTKSLKNAKRYRNYKAAEKAMEKLQRAHVGAMMVVELETVQQTKGE